MPGLPTVLAPGSPVYQTWAATDLLSGQRKISALKQCTEPSARLLLVGSCQDRDSDKGTDCNLCHRACAVVPGTVLSVGFHSLETVAISGCVILCCGGLSRAD